MQLLNNYANCSVRVNNRFQVLGEIVWEITQDFHHPISRDIGGGTEQAALNPTGVVSRGAGVSSGGVR